MSNDCSTRRATVGTTAGDGQSILTCTSSPKKIAFTARRASRAASSAVRELERGRAVSVIARRKHRFVLSTHVQIVGR